MKVRLYVRPPGSPSTLLEVELSEGEGAASETQLKCFSPPPGDQGEAAEWGPTKAWAVDLSGEEAGDLSSKAAAIRLVPFGDAAPRGGGTPLELSLSSGQAEARLSWWMRAPSEWGVVEDVVQTLIDLSLRDR